MKKIIILFTLLVSTVVHAYTYSEEGNQTGAGKITKVYGGRDTSFVYFNGDMSGRCPFGGMYLGDPDSTLTSAQQGRLLALALAAQAQGKNVVLMYKYTTDTSASSFMCYAYGIQVEE